MSVPTNQNTKHNAPLPPPVDLVAAPTGPYFCYGTLTDPSTIARILNLAEEPELRPAYIKGYKIKDGAHTQPFLTPPALLLRASCIMSKQSRMARNWPPTKPITIALSLVFSNTQITKEHRKIWGTPLSLLGIRTIYAKARSI